MATDPSDDVPIGPPMVSPIRVGEPEIIDARPPPYARVLNTAVKVVGLAAGIVGILAGLRALGVF